MENFLNFLKSQNYQYKKPSVLFGTQNNKTVKGEAKGYKTFIIYMSPEKQNTLGKNLCPKASEGCKQSCLFTAGMGAFSNVKIGRINKTEYFLKDRVGFMQQAAKEIKKAVKKHGAENIAIRLNGTTDIPFENIPFEFEGEVYSNIMEIFPDVQFYDYTKVFNRFTKKLPANYDLTFSRSEDERNQTEAEALLILGHNVAAVFKNQLPAFYGGYQIIDGDETDLTFLHPKGVILGLKAKGKAKKDISGFVINN